MSGLPGGNLYDIKAIVQHVLYEQKREGKDISWPLVMLGTVTTAIGATMIFHGGKKIWADHVKAEAADKAKREH